MVNVDKINIRKTLFIKVWTIYPVSRSAFFPPSKLSFFGRKLENKKKKKKKKTRTGTSSYRKIYAFMACILYFKETECKTSFQLVK